MWRAVPGDIAAHPGVLGQGEKEFKDLLSDALCGAWLN